MLTEDIPECYVQVAAIEIVTLIPYYTDTQMCYFNPEND